ncbi:MAG: DUF1461 domain-containing protein [Nanoarchaeota archaeon]|nr:DUF1461 domain-containing protein [Nanoarchaeota archaeon]
MKNNQTLITALFVICICLAVPIINFNLIKDNKQTYTDIAPEYQDINQNILGYYHNQDSLNTSVLNEREVQHLADVKHVMETLDYVLYACLAILLILSLVSFYHKNINYPYIVILSGTVMLVAAIFIFLLSNTNFDLVFVKMHEMLFSAGTWTFDTETELLTNIYSQDFFFNFAKRLFLNIIASALVLVSTGIIIKKFIYKSS